MIRVPIALTAFVFVILLPVLEVGPTHLVHPGWPGHARLHEAWQLLANASLAAVCLWLAYRRNQIFDAALVALAAVAPFLFAAALQPLYGGSFSHVDGSPPSLSGYAAVPVMALLSAGLLAVLFRLRRPTT